MAPRGTKLRNIRIPDELWDAARAKAASEGSDVSAVVREFLTEYVMPPPGPSAP